MCFIPFLDINEIVPAFPNGVNIRNGTRHVPEDNPEHKATTESIILQDLQVSNFYR
jgi:hypothetical protein